MHPFPIPVVALGPGSQPEHDALDYLPMPRDMRTWHAPILPESELIGGHPRVHALLGRLLEAARDWRPGAAPIGLDLAGLTPADRRLIDQVLGEGEVSAQVTEAGCGLAIQESVFAGIWRLRGRTHDGLVFADRIEVGDVPAAVRQAGRAGQAAPAIPATATASAVAPGLASAPALLAEIAARLHDPAEHVINLSLLPFTPEDGACLDAALGRGSAAMLSRGYGNCRITATGVARVWWVQYFNAQDTLILNTIEIAEVPEVARAAREDLEDSAERLAEVIKVLGSE